MSPAAAGPVGVGRCVLRGDHAGTFHVTVELEGADDGWKVTTTAWFCEDDFPTLEEASAARLDMIESVRNEQVPA